MHKLKSVFIKEERNFPGADSGNFQKELTTKVDVADVWEFHSG